MFYCLFENMKCIREGTTIYFQDYDLCDHNCDYELNCYSLRFNNFVHFIAIDVMY